MNIRIFLFQVVVGLLIISSSALGRDKPNIQFDNLKIQNVEKNNKSIEEACELIMHNNYYAGFSTGQQPHDKLVTYFDPADCGDPTYPFEISSISFFFRAHNGFQWPVTMDIVVFAPAIPNDKCSAPDVELYRFSITCDYLNWTEPFPETAVFPEPLCVSEPVFIGVEYNDPGDGPFPSLAFDTAAAPDSCDNWYYYDEPTLDTNWMEWYDFWENLPGYPLFWIDGETVSSVCSIDSDADGIDDSEDNCPNNPNTDQLDFDTDGLGDVCDNCPDDSNPTQEDSDNDGIGNICDICPEDAYNDPDNDGICESIDNCPGYYNPTQTDSDLNGWGDVCHDCCVGIRGNIDNLATIDIADLVYYVDYMFLIPHSPQPPCFKEADMVVDGEIDIADLVFLVEFQFSSGPPPPDCF